MRRLIAIFLFLISGSIYAQTCPTNLSFDANNISFWEFKAGRYSGSYAASYTNTINPVPSKASVIQTAKDVFNSANNALTIFKANADGTLTSDEMEPSIKKVPVINGYKYQYSVRIGNSTTGGSADKLTYRITVPTGLSTYNITYAYAAVLQDPNHSASQQPAFAATVSDLSQPAGSQTISCASKRYFSNTSLPITTYDASARYISWQEVSFDLSQYAGKTIEMKFEAFDCQPTGHYGYAYLAFRNDGCGTGEITGNNLICSSTSALTYSTPIVDGASFSWTLPYGWTGSSTTNSITVNPNGNAGGNITVTPSQSCGNITTRSLSITTVNSTPSTPGSITGESTICSGSSNLTYSVAPVSNASSYTWTYPAGWTIVSGLNTNNITFNANSSSGSITVKSNNLCGSSSVTSSSISVVNNPLSSAGVISGVPSTIQCTTYFPANLTLGTSVGSVTKWMYSTNGGISYQDIANTTSVLSINPTSSTFYKAEVKNGSCVASQSSPVLVNVYSPIEIVNHPQSINTCAGSSKTFSVTAVGDGTLSYNWQISTNGGSSWGNISSNPANYSGYNSATLTVNAAAVTSGTNNLYQCVISSSTNCSPVTSLSANLVVNNSVTPVINTQPSSRTVCTGSVASIEVTATGPSLTYQWQSATSLNGTYSNISGQNSSRLNISTTSAAVLYYRCLITETCGGLNVLTDHVTVTVTASTTASVVIAANNNNVCSGTSIVYSATSTNGGTNPTYSWYKNNSLISGEVLDTFTSSSIANNDVIYAVMTSNKSCAIGSPASSNSIVNTILTSPSITSVVNNSRCGVGSVTLSATASTGTISWFTSSTGGSALSTGTSYATGSISTSQNYYVSASDGTCTSASRTIVTATINALNISISGNATDYDLVSLTASGGNTYSWDGGNSQNSASNTFDESGTYQVSVSNALGCTGTQSIVVVVKLRGLSRNGELLDSKVNQVSRFGEKGSDFPMINSGLQKRYSKFSIVNSNLKLNLSSSENASYSGSGTTWTDISSSGLSATLHNGISYNNRNGGTLSFDGINDYVSLSGTLGSFNNLTVESWVYPGTFGGFSTILNMTNWSTGYFHFQFDGNRIQFALNGESDKYADYVFSVNKWYHIVVSYNKSAKTVNFYVNGKFINSESYSNPPSIANQSFNIGAWNDNGVYDRFFNGKIGAVRIYNSNLTESQIGNNYKNNKHNFGL